MRHRKDTSKLNRTTSHRRCLVANMLKALIMRENIKTTLAKAKTLRRDADRMITLAKKNTLASRRLAIARLMVRYNKLSDKQAREAREGKKQGYNDDRQVIEKLFGVLGSRFAERQGGYTRIVKGPHRVGDNAQQCVIQYLQA